MAGWIEVICGSMFSGKTEELIRRLKRANFAHQRVQIFKPALDVRYSDKDVVSHDRNSIESNNVDSSQNILLLATDVDVIGIDEVQFFDDGIVDVCNQLADRGVRVICAGLDMDYLGNPFWSYACIDGCGRACYKSSCNLRQVRTTSSSLPPYLRGRQTCNAGRTGQIRAPVSPLLQCCDDCRKEI